MKWSVFLFTVVAVAVVAAAPYKDSNQRIIGGIDANKASPYIVSLTDNEQHFCGGFIYSAKWVVTTASCVAGRATSRLKAVVGQYSFLTLDENEESISVFRVIPIDTYVPENKTNNIALLELSREINLSDDLHYATYGEVAPGNAILRGWGIKEDGFDSTTLRETNLTIIGGSICPGYTNQDYSSRTMLCAVGNITMGTNPTPVSTPCTLDEGSPLVQANATGNGEVVVGLYSSNQGCVEPLVPDIPSIFTRVSVFYAWLLRTAGQQQPPSTTAAPTSTTPAAP